MLLQCELSFRRNERGILYLLEQISENHCTAAACICNEKTRRASKRVNELARMRSASCHRTFITFGEINNRNAMHDSHSQLYESVAVCCDGNASAYQLLQNVITFDSVIYLHVTHWAHRNPAHKHNTHKMQSANTVFGVMLHIGPRNKFPFVFHLYFIIFNCNFSGKYLKYFNEFWCVFQFRWVAGGHDEPARWAQND